MSGTSPWLRRGLIGVLAVVVFFVCLGIERRYGVPGRVVLAIGCFLFIAVLAPFEVWKWSKRRGTDRRWT